MGSDLLDVQWLPATCNIADMQKTLHASNFGLKTEGAGARWRPLAPAGCSTGS